MAIGRTVKWRKRADGISYLGKPIDYFYGLSDYRFDLQLAQETSLTYQPAILQIKKQIENTKKFETIYVQEFLSGFTAKEMVDAAIFAAYNKYGRGNHPEKIDIVRLVLESCGPSALIQQANDRMPDYLPVGTLRQYTHVY